MEKIHSRSAKSNDRRNIYITISTKSLIIDGGTEIWG